MPVFSNIANSQTGAAVRAILNSALAMLNIRPRFLYAFHSGDTANSLMHAAAGGFVAGDQVSVKWYDSNLDAESGGVLVCAQARGSIYAGTLGTLANGGTSGLILEGQWYRWAIVPDAGGVIDLRRCGIRCVEGATGWHSRFAAAVDFAKNQPRTFLTGSGVLTCTETVVVDRAFCDFSRLRFQGGVHAANGSTVAPSTFFTAAQSNNAVTITQANPGKVQWVAHGLAADTLIYLTTNGKLPGGLATWLTGVGNGLRAYYVRNPTANDFEIAFTAGGASLSTLGSAGFGQHYVFQAGSQANITTQDIVRWDGKGQRLGIVVRAGTNGSNKDFVSNKLTVWGDGNSDRTTPPSCICVRHEADDSPNGTYEYTTNYGYIGVGVQGPAEKHTLTVRGVYQRHLVYNLANASCDTLRVRIHGANCQAWYTETEGADTTLAIDFSTESRDDPASDASSDGADMPAILVRNGKHTDLYGEMRANNGVRNVLVWGVNNGTGASGRVGADTVRFNLRMVHGYGCAVELRAARYATGNVLVKDWDDPNGSQAQNAPAFRIGRVFSAAGLQVHGVAIKNYEGLHVGDAAALDMASGAGYYPKEVDLGKWSIDMGTILQFNPDGTERSGSGAHPTTSVAARIRKWNNCVINLSGSRGNVEIDSATSGGTVMVDPLMKIFTINDNSTPAASIGYPTLSTSGLTIT